MSWMHPPDFHTDRRCITLLASEGIEAYAVLMFLYEQCMSNAGAMHMHSICNVSYISRLEVSRVEGIVETCIRVGLFRRNDAGDLYSPDISDDYARQEKNKQKRIDAANKRWSRKEISQRTAHLQSTCDGDAMHMHSTCNTYAPTSPPIYIYTNKDLGTGIGLGSNTGSSPEVGGPGGGTQAKPEQNEHPPVDRPLLPTSIEPSKTPRAIKAEPLVPGCNFFRMNSAEREKVERWYRKNELPPELLSLAILQVDAWMDAGSKAAAVKARGSPTHYRQLTAAWVIENASKILRSKQNGFRNGQFLNEAEKKQNFFADLERKIAGENDNGRVRNGEIFETNFTVMAEPKGD